MMLRNLGLSYCKIVVGGEGGNLLRCIKKWTPLMKPLVSIKGYLVDLMQLKSSVNEHYFV